MSGLIRFCCVVVSIFTLGLSTSSIAQVDCRSLSNELLWYNSTDSIPELSDNLVELGAGIHPAGDIDGNGVSDLILTDRTGGFVVLMLNEDGSILTSREIDPDVVFTDPRIIFNTITSIHPYGDLDGDGRVELLFGMPTSFAGLGQFVIVYFNSDGTVKDYRSINVNSLTALGTISKHGSMRHLGYTVAPFGDVDGDGTTDLALTAQTISGPRYLPGEDTGSSNIAIFFMTEQGTIREASVQPFESEYPASFFSLLSAGDSDSNGLSEMIVFPHQATNSNARDLEILEFSPTGGLLSQSSFQLPAPAPHPTEEGLTSLYSEVKGRFTTDLDGNGVRDLVVTTVTRYSNLDYTSHLVLILLKDEPGMSPLSMHRCMAGTTTTPLSSSFTAPLELFDYKGDGDKRILLPNLYDEGELGEPDLSNGNVIALSTSALMALEPLDECPTDPGKSFPGVCGCGTPDVDTDNDGRFDCQDECTGPGIDSDGDGTNNSCDLCPDDPLKVEPGRCGCMKSDLDNFCHTPNNCAMVEILDDKYDFTPESMTPTVSYYRRIGGMEGVGDLDGDSVADYVVGYPLTQQIGTFLMNADGTVKQRQFFGLETFTDAALANAAIGADVAAFTDLDNDGITEIVVGTPNAGETQRTGGLMVVFLSATGGVKSYQRLTDLQFPSSVLLTEGAGSDVEVFPDLNDDGVPEIAFAVPECFSTNLNEFTSFNFMLHVDSSLNTIGTSFLPGRLGAESIERLPVDPAQGLATFLVGSTFQPDLRFAPTSPASSFPVSTTSETYTTPPRGYGAPLSLESMSDTYVSESSFSFVGAFRNSFDNSLFTLQRWFMTRDRFESPGLDRRWECTSPYLDESVIADVDLERIPDFTGNSVEDFLVRVQSYDPVSDAYTYKQYVFDRRTNYQNIDLCPGDPEKTFPGLCGCGSSDDIDSDSDGQPDCRDLCPGVDDGPDTDRDGTPDGCDECPLDSQHTSTPPEGCSVSTPQAFLDMMVPGEDLCPEDPNKTVPGRCGCGVDEEADADGDSVPDCIDKCDGFDDSIDRDNDTFPDSCDACPLDEAKITPGTCGCGVSDRFDFDRDGVPNCIDRCPRNDDTLDRDGDGVPDGCDGCPDDAGKREEGLCGCGITDTSDSDSDGVNDCNDQCPGFDDTIDTDGDGFADGCDPCSDDAFKRRPGACGCGIVEVDEDGDGRPDCLTGSEITDVIDDIEEKENISKKDLRKAIADIIGQVKRNGLDLPTIRNKKQLKKQVKKLSKLKKKLKKAKGKKLARLQKQLSKLGKKLLGK